MDDILPVKSSSSWHEKLSGFRDLIAETRAFVFDVKLTIHFM